MVSDVRPQEASVNRRVNEHVNFVRVGGRYRIGKLLGAGGSGMPNSGSTLILRSELSRECLFRELKLP